MAVYVFGGTKGGIGKSTMAVNAAAWLSEDGAPIALLDTDTQKHASGWAGLRAARGGAPNPLRVEVAYGMDVRPTLVAMQSQCAHVVVDAGGRDSVELRTAMLFADVLALPFQPALFDYWAGHDTRKIAAEGARHNPRMRTLAFVNRASTNWASDVAELARGALAELFPVASTIVRQRQAFATSLETGRAVHELGRRGGPAADEFTSLWLEIEGSV